MDGTHGAVLCVPDAMATSVDCEKDTVNDRTSLRRLLFNELHSQPCGGHRGIAATELALPLYADAITGHICVTVQSKRTDCGIQTQSAR